MYNLIEKAEFYFRCASRPFKFKLTVPDPGSRDPPSLEKVESRGAGTATSNTVTPDSHKYSVMWKLKLRHMPQTLDPEPPRGVFASHPLPPLPDMSPLPTEILLEIAAQLPANLGRETLRQCALASRTFRDIFQPWIYKTILFVDAGSVTHRPDLNGWNVTNTPRLFDTLSARPELGLQTRKVAVGLRDGSHDELLPDLLLLFPCVECFELLGLSGRRNWTYLRPEMQQGVTRMCQLPSLLSLRFSEFFALPSSLLLTNPNIGTLEVDKVLMFTQNTPNENVHNDFNNDPVDIPPYHFQSLRRIKCFCPTFVEKRQWLATAIRSAGASGTLRSLSLTIVSCKDRAHGLGIPINLTPAPNLAYLSLGRIIIQCNADGAAGFFTSFCQLVNDTIATLNKKAVLERLQLCFDLGHTPDTLEATIWNTPEWLRLSDAIKAKGSTIRSIRVLIGFNAVYWGQHDPQQSRFVELALLNAPPNLTVEISSFLKHD